MKILENSEQDYEVVNYIDSPLSVEELKLLANKMGIQASQFIRKKESIFKELDLQKHLDNNTILFQYMSKNPKLMERPIIVRGDKAVLGRPPEKIIEFLKD